MADRPVWWPTLVDVGDAALALVTTAAGLAVGIGLVDGVSADNPGAVLLVALAVAIGDLVLRAPLRLLARATGAPGAVAAGVVAQTVVAWGALRLVPGVTASSAWAVVAVLVVAAMAMAAGRWAWGVNDSEYVVGDVLRRSRAAARRAGAAGARPGAERPAGLLVVILDGVSAPVLREAVEAGLAPTLARWLDRGSHRLEEWWAGAPATTPASQAGLLHASTAVPAFRWWDRDLGRLVVSNHPVDAARLEAQVSTGDGLLAHDGVAVATMLSGDAPTALLVMSRAGRRDSGASYLRFFASPFVLARAVGLTVGEMVKELYQARRQRVRGVTPRVSRTGWYVLLRGVSNVALRDLATSLVAEHLVRGAPTVCVDYVDYDEIAHHAGPRRPEAMRALEGLDRVLGILEQVLPVAGRDYRVVVASDHGQSLGTPFSQVAHATLTQTVRDLMDRCVSGPVRAVQAGDGEDWGPINALLTSLTSRRRDRAVVLGPDADQRAAGQADVVVAASGNLGMVWFPGLPRRPSLDEVQDRWPGLVAALAAQPGIGVVVVDTAERGLVAVGSGGLVLLEQKGHPVEGIDPLAGYGVRAAKDLAGAARRPHAGDLVLVSSVTPDGHVHAFEEQVGSHGGLGGEQNRALLVHPTELTLDDDLAGPAVPGDEARLVGAERVHAQLVRWQRQLDLRP